MSKFSCLIRIVAAEDGREYFADTESPDKVTIGASMQGFSSIDALLNGQGGKEIRIRKVGYPMAERRKRLTMSSSWLQHQPRAIRYTVLA